jgi:hypothetical protein
LIQNHRYVSIYHMSHITYHISHITHHTSHITHHISYVAYHVSCIIYHISISHISQNVKKKNNCVAPQSASWPNAVQPHLRLPEPRVPVPRSAGCDYEIAITMREGARQGAAIIVSPLRLTPVMEYVRTGCRQGRTWGGT